MHRAPHGNVHGIVHATVHATVHRTVHRSMLRTNTLRARRGAPDSNAASSDDNPSSRCSSHWPSGQLRSRAAAAYNA